MSEYREQALLMAAKVFGEGVEAMRFAVEHPESDYSADEVYIRAYVALAERMLQLEAALKELRDEHGCDCGDEAHEEGCPIKTISAALKGD